MRPDIVLLLQPWSTAMSQPKNSRIAPVPITFISMCRLSDQLELRMLMVNAKVRGSREGVIGCKIRQVALRV